MPALKNIDLSDGINIDSTTLAKYELKAASFPAGNIPQVESLVNSYLKTAFEVIIPLDSLDVNDPLRQPAPTLSPRQEIVGSDLVTTTMFVVVHIFSLAPLEFTIVCSNSPPSSDWWVDDDKGD